MEASSLYLLLACAFGFLMACGVGANDVSNAMGTSVGSRAITLKQAIIIAILFEFTGAFLAGGEVTNTLSKGIIDISAFSDDRALVLGMIATLMAGATWLILASALGWPVSTSHTIVGSILAFGLYELGPEQIYWGSIGRIGISWVLSPFLGLIFAYTLFWTVQRFILDTVDPLLRARRLIPYYMFLVGWIISSIVLFSGLEHLNIELVLWQKLGYSFLASLAVTLIGIVLLRRVKLDPAADQSFHYTNVERLFRILMLFTACSMAFAHGSNDVANAIGPVAAVISILKVSSNSLQASNVPQWILILGAMGIVTGLVVYGHKVIATIGTGITELTPSRGFCAELAAATTVVLASSTGLPISTTHTLVGAILGVGLARGINALNRSTIQRIFLSWLITLPAGAFLTLVFYQGLTFFLP